MPNTRLRYLPDLGIYRNRLDTTGTRHGMRGIREILKRSVSLKFVRNGNYKNNLLTGS